MAQLRVRRWVKGPHDRLYISTAGGMKVGWFDLRTQRQHLDVPGMWPQFQQAVTTWRTEHAGTGANGPAVAVGVRAWAPVGRPDDRVTAEEFLRQLDQKPERPVPAGTGGLDLATRRPGHNAAVMAARLAPRRRWLRVLARVLGIRTRDRSWRVGAAGERTVGGRLDRLTRHGWRVLHAVELGLGGDVDHLLIGPAGVFVVNTKHHPNAVVKVGRKVVFVRGRQQPYTAKSGREAARVRLALSGAAGRPVHVAPLIVMHGHRHLRGWITNRPQGVQVLPSRLVTWWLRLPGRVTLPPAEVESLYAVARRPGTWVHC